MRQKEEYPFRWVCLDGSQVATQKKQLHLSVQSSTSTTNTVSSEADIYIYIHIYIYINPSSIVQFVHFWRIKAPVSPSAGSRLRSLKVLGIQGKLAPRDSQPARYGSFSSPWVVYERKDAPRLRWTDQNHPTRLNACPLRTRSG